MLGGEGAQALLVGRRFDEVADIACRICSICGKRSRACIAVTIARSGISIALTRGGNTAQLCMSAMKLDFRS